MFISIMGHSLKIPVQAARHWRGDILFSKLKREISSLSGIYPPLSTPFTGEGEEIAWEKLKNNIEKYNKIDFKGYVVQGSNGEYVSLSKNEKIKIVNFVKKNASNDKIILAGSGCEGTRETIDLTNSMAASGADFALVATPSFFKNRMNSFAMIKHYEKVADASKIPVILYNVPSNTGIEFPLDAIIHLAKHSNIVGLKDSGGNITSIAQVLNETKSEQFEVLAGSASFLFASQMLGAVGGICALANILGNECVRLYGLVNDNRLEEARRLQLSLVAPNQAVTRKYNVPGLKYAMDLFGYYGGPCRLPLTEVTEAEKADIKKSFQDFLPKK